MKTISVVFATILFSGYANAASVSSMGYPSVSNQEKAGQFGVGLTVGSLTGVSGQYWMGNDRTINGAFATERENTAISLAHLWLFHDAFAGSGREANYFVPYIGVGAIAAFGTRSDYFTRDDENFALAAQIPLGMEFLPGPERFDIFAEIAPSIEITPTPGGFLTANIGARFYF